MGRLRGERHRLVSAGEPVDPGWYSGGRAERTPLYEYAVVLEHPTAAIMSKVGAQVGAPARAEPSKFQFYTPSGSASPSPFVCWATSKLTAGSFRNQMSPRVEQYSRSSARGTPLIGRSTTIMCRHGGTRIRLPQSGLAACKSKRTTIRLASDERIRDGSAALQAEKFVTHMQDEQAKSPSEPSAPRPVTPVATRPTH